MVVVREKLQDTLLKGLGKAEEYGLFLANKEDPKKGVWLDRQKSLSYYMLENRVRNILSQPIIEFDVLRNDYRII